MVERSPLPPAALPIESQMPRICVNQIKRERLRTPRDALLSAEARMRAVPAAAWLEIARVASPDVLRAGLIWPFRCCICIFSCENAVFAAIMHF